MYILPIMSVIVAGTLCPMQLFAVRMKVKFLLYDTSEKETEWFVVVFSINVNAADSWYEYW